MRLSLIPCLALMLILSACGWLQPLQNIRQTSNQTFQIQLAENLQAESARFEPILERFTQTLEALPLAPQQKITVEIRSCRQASAFYMPSERLIVMCPGLLDTLTRRFGESQGQETFHFVMLHELAHALIDQLNLPILGNEEDAADAMATVLLLEQANSPIGAILAGIDFYEQYQQGFITPWAGVHAIGPQRMFNLVCWASGGQPNLLENRLIRRLHSEMQAFNRNCSQEYSQQEQAVKTLLGLS